MNNQTVTNPRINGAAADDIDKTVSARKAGSATLPEADIPPQEHSENLDEALYEGTVKLIVDAHGRTERMLQFVDELGRNPNFRLLRLVGNYQKKGMDVWLGLREPLHLMTLLRETEGVSLVMGDAEPQPEGDERALQVALVDYTAE